MTRESAGTAGPEPGRGFARVEASRRWQSIWMSAARMTAAVIAMAIPIVLVRVLDQTTFGHYKQLFLVANTALALLTLGMPASLYYFVPRSPKAAQRIHVQSALLLGVVGVGAGVALAFSGPLLERYFHAPLRPYALWIGLFTALSIPGMLIPVSPMVDRRARLAATLTASLDILRALLLVSVAVITRDLVAILVAACTIAFLRVASLVTYLGWRGRREPGERREPGLLRKQLGYALPFAAAAFVGLIREKLHAYYVAASFSAAEFAVYAIATLNIPLIGLFTRTVGEVVILANAENYAADRKEEMRRVWHRATYSLALVLLPIFVICEVFASDLITVLFGPSYAGAAPIFRVYILIVPLSILLASPMLRATADLKVMFAADSTALLITILTLVLLVGTLGPLGAVTSLVAGKAAFMLFASRRTAARLELGAREFLPWKGLFLVLALAAGAAFGGLALTSRLGPAARLLVGGGLAGAAYLSVALATGLVPEPERALLRRALRGRRGHAGPRDDA
ncbi:MAG: lipopolysaccharide biosynthesis protein [Gemmatimonadota bacterium]